MDILFLGGDSRMRYAAELLSDKYSVRFSGGQSPVIVLPVPLSKDGVHIFAPLGSEAVPFEDIPRFALPNALVLAGGSSPALCEVCRAHDLRLVNYFSSERLTLCNAALTAEAAISLLANSTDGSILGSSILITGFGRIAKALAARLAPFSCAVTITARRVESLCEAELLGCRALPLDKLPLSDFDFIINTVPAPLFSAEDFSRIKRGCVFLELASLPNTPPAANLQYIHGGGLPGRCSPKTAGYFIAQELLNLLRDSPKTQ